MPERHLSRRLRRRQLLVVTPSDPTRIGGVERHVRETTSRLVEAGWGVQIICAEPGGQRRRTFDVDGVEVVVLRAHPAERDLFLVPGLWSEMAAASADVVHVQSYHTFVAPLAMARARSLALPYVLTFHGGGSSIGLRNRARRTQRRLQRGLYRRAFGLVAVARFEIEQYARELRLERDRFTLIPNGTERPVGDDGPVTDAAPLEPGGPARIATIGRLELYKGHHRVIAALPDLLARRPGSELLVVGTGPYEAELRRLVVRLGVREHVRFTSVPPGDAGAMGRLLTSLDAVVLMSEFETHPLVALEAAAVRRRMVVADVGGLSELAAQGFGRPVPLGISPQALAGIINDELSGPAPAVAPDRFSWDDCAQALAELYARAADPRARM